MNQVAQLKAQVTPPVYGQVASKQVQNMACENTVELQEVLKKLLGVYEKAKGHIEQIASSSSDTGSAGDVNLPAFDSKDIGNFFMIVFKYLNAHANDASKLEIAQAINMQSQEMMLDNLTSEAMSSLNEMQSEVDESNKKENSGIGVIFKIVLPIVVGLVLTAVGIGTAMTPAASAAASAGGTAADAAENTIMQTLKGVATRIAGGLAKTAAFVTPTVTAATLAFPIAATAVTNKNSTEVSDETTLEQGTLTVNSAANNSVNNTIKMDMQYQQNEQSETQADDSMELNMLQTQTKVFNIGN